MLLIEHTYVKPRFQFGKQCVFEFDDRVAEENIWPDPELMENYILQAECDRDAQKSTQFAAHEVQTAKKVIRSTGMFHFEGGWPKEINPRDSEAVQRYRRRVEKDDNWVLSMRHLIPSMEHNILQNNAVNIYENYFDDMVPTSLVMEYDIRIRNSYEDPQTRSRPIKHLSWSPNGSNRLAAAYSFAEFDVHPADINSYSYVWDIENPNIALAALKSSSPLMTVEFNPRDPSLLISGLMSGQVCSWDIRKGDEPVQTSHPFFSHRYPASQALWITSKANAEFFSSSTNGTVMWWDTRFLKKPTDTLVMDLDDPARADIYRAVGVTALQFEPTISSRFLAGTEKGVVVNVNRRGNNPVEKLAMRFQCYAGPVIAVDRNPAFTKNFLTIGDWAAKVWAEDTREGCLLSTCDESADLSGGCWSRSRCSVFFTINTRGSLEAYDVLTGVQAPLASIHISSHSLTAISPHEDGEYLAVGSCNGNVYLLECTEGLTTFTKDDKALLSAYFERGGRYEKLVDQRVKEIRLLYGSYHDAVPRVRKRGSMAKDKRVESKERKKQRGANEEKEKTESLKKPKRGKSKRKTTVANDSVLAAIEEDYFRTIEAESMKFVEVDAGDVEAAQELLKQRIVTRPQEEESDTEKEDPRKDRKSMMLRRMTSRTRRRRRQVQSSGETLPEEEPSLEVDPQLMKRIDAKKRAAKVLRKSCRIEVCKPEICCTDMEEKRRAERSKKKLARKLEEAEEDPGSARPFYTNERWYRRLTDYVDEIPERSSAFKTKMLALKKLPPSVLREELKQAKIEARDWQERAIARKLAAPMVGEEPRVKPEEKPAAMQETPKQEVVAEVKGSGTKQTLSFEDKATRVKRARRSRRPRLTQDEIDRQQQQEEREELWRMLKQKVKEHEPLQEETYPRISAAFARRSSEDLGNLETK